MQFDLFKIMDKRYVEDFRSGTLYMNTIRFFHDRFRDQVIGDAMEGSFIARDKSVLSKYDPEFLKYLHPTVLFEDDNYASTHIFCMYSVQVDHRRRWVLRPKEELLKFCNSEADNAEMVAVRVVDTGRFINLVSASLKRLVKTGDCNYAEMGHMKYTNSWPVGRDHSGKNGYVKDHKYGYQQEWRIHASFIPKPCGPTKLYVGSLHEITEVADLADFVLDVGKLYPGYTVVDTALVSPNHHRSFGNLQIIQKGRIPGREMVCLTGEEL